MQSALKLAHWTDCPPCQWDWKSQEKYRPKERESCQQSGFTLTWHQQHTYSIRLPIYPETIVHTAEPVFPANPNKASKPHTKTSGRRQQLNDTTTWPCADCHTCSDFNAVTTLSLPGSNGLWHKHEIWCTLTPVDPTQICQPRCQVWHGFSTNCKKGTLSSAKVSINLAWKFQS